MMNYPTWPCSYSSLPQQIEEKPTAKKKKKKAKALAVKKPIQKPVNIDIDDPFDNLPYNFIYADNDTKKQFISSLDDFISKFSKEIINFKNSNHYVSPSQFVATNFVPDDSPF